MSAKQIKEYAKAIGDSLSNNSIFSFINRIEVYIYRPSKED